MRGDISVAISLGNQTDFAITNDGNLLVVNNYSPPLNVSINLGQCTKKRIEQLQDYLERLKIHATDA